MAIAKACGWTKFTPDTIQFTAQRADGKWGLIPDYLNDLNAMHEAEKVLRCSVDYIQIHAWNNYCIRLGFFLRPQDVHDNNCIHATAEQRAEAFLKTLNLWTP